MASFTSKNNAYCLPNVNAFLECSGNFCWSINTLTFFPFLFKRNMKIVLLGSFNDCIVWTPSQRTLQLHIKLWQLIIWVTKY